MRATILKCCQCCLAAVTLTFALSVARPKLTPAPQSATADGPCIGSFLPFAKKFVKDQSWKENGVEGFKLSQCYPQDEPRLSREELPWYDDKERKELDFLNKKDQARYLAAILEYCYQENLENDWVVEKNKKRKWFHAPWMDYGGTGREPIRGLTYELPSTPGKLAERQERMVQNWAVSFYNAPGGYVLGQVWKNSQAPDPKKAVFPNGTVAVKLLFTEATADEVPYLTGQEGREWQAYI
jgi:hypothetical protein